MEFADFCKKRKIVWNLNTINQINIALEASYIYSDQYNLCKFSDAKIQWKLQFYIIKKRGGTDVFDFFFILQRWLKKYASIFSERTRGEIAFLPFSGHPSIDFVRNVYLDYLYNGYRALIIFNSTVSNCN